MKPHLVDGNWRKRMDEFDPNEYERELEMQYNYEYQRLMDIIHTCTNNTLCEHCDANGLCEKQYKEDT